MKSTKSNRVRALLAAATTLATVLGALVATPASAVSVNPAAVCANGSCTVTFDYTGDYYQWAPPVGIRTLWFDVFGAQGGRSGGLGGKISGRFTNIPASLFVYVGGQGKTGSGQTGGFGGGGGFGDRPARVQRTLTGESASGTVKFFNSMKGFGFIQRDDGQPDAFVHISAVERAGMGTLNEGDRVKFDVEVDNRGKNSAVNLSQSD